MQNDVAAIGNDAKADYYFFFFFWGEKTKQFFFFKYKPPFCIYELLFGRQWKIQIDETGLWEWDQDILKREKALRGHYTICMMPRDLF